MDEYKSLNDAGREAVVEPQNPEDDGRARVVDAQEDGQGTESAGEGEGAQRDAADPGNAGRDVGHAAQSRRINQEAKAARLQAQKETETRIRAEYDREIAAAGLEDPFTGKRVESFAELKRYTEKLREERLSAEAKRTGKSMAVLREEEENREFLSGLRRSAKQREAQPAPDDAQGFDLAADAAAFAEAHPDVDLVKLEQDKGFRRFAGSRLYRESIAALYEDYLEIAKDAAQVAQVKAQSKAQRSTGSGDGGGDVKLTRAQQRDLEAWNAKYPNMKMSAKEYAGR